MNARSIRTSWLAASIGIFVLIATASPRIATAQSSPDEGAPALGAVQFHDGSAWMPMGLHNGAVEGAEGASAATALLRSQLGGPKTYFVIPGAASETSISIARPRFRVEGDAAMVRLIQLAILDVKDESRRTAVGAVKGGAARFLRKVELEAKEMRSGVWELRPKKSLQPGEYALAIGVDGPAADFTIAARGY
ncbi:MAG TPA: hypothetical protein VLT84_03910 [Acidobacteriota bacterium]|nr:hypothetical protein [Acidobacteriota bacterium]